ncbi:hypothetical protein [uncultured Cohaesibacter sp.]|uniref:hypothetical protein n=1 Tax=uncultured Cohaesibacter sp. TaxID=1002546 RepID=UPI00292FAFD3|nr:hypothetical protein [uncultured Cohaesibacter sp.]
MQGIEKLKDKLKLYLATLSESAQKLLLRSLEKAQQDGSSDIASDFILMVLREILASEKKLVPLDKAAKKQFFRDACFFFAEVDLPEKMEACINPSSVEAIWSWIKNDIASQDQRNRLQQDCSYRSKSDIDRLTMEWCAELVLAIKKRLKAAEKEFGGEQKLIKQLGGDHVFKDLMDILSSSERLTPLKPILARMAKGIESWSSPEGADAYQLISRYVQQSPLRSNWVFSATSKKLETAQLKLELVTKLSGSNDSTQIFATAYAPAVHQLIAVMQARVGLAEELVSDLSRQAETVEHVTEWRKLLKAMELALEIPGKTPWGKSLTQMKKRMRELLEEEIEAAPSTLRKAFRAPINDELEAVEDDHLSRAIKSASLFKQAELAKETLALNGPISDARKELDQTFELLNSSLVERTRKAIGQDTHTLEKLHAASISIAEQLFDKDYAMAFSRQLRAASMVQDLKIAG